MCPSIYLYNNKPVLKVHPSEINKDESPDLGKLVSLKKKYFASMMTKLIAECSKHRFKSGPSTKTTGCFAEKPILTPEGA